MTFLHEHGVRGFVAFNTLIFPSELEDAAEQLRNAIAEAVSRRHGIAAEELNFEHARIRSNDRTVDLSWIEADQ